MGNEDHDKFRLTAGTTRVSSSHPLHRCNGRRETNVHPLHVMVPPDGRFVQNVYRHREESPHSAGVRCLLVSQLASRRTPRRTITTVATQNIHTRNVQHYHPRRILQKRLPPPLLECVNLFPLNPVSLVKTPTLIARQDPSHLGCGHQGVPCARYSARDYHGTANNPDASSAVSHAVSGAADDADRSSISGKRHGSGSSMGSEIGEHQEDPFASAR